MILSYSISKHQRVAISGQSEYHMNPAHYNAHQRDSMIKLFTIFLRLQFSNFRYSLNLFSMYFVCFPRHTCALLVSNTLSTYFELQYQATGLSGTSSWRRQDTNMNQIFTRFTALFQRTLIELAADRKPPVHNLANCNADAQIDMVKLSLFTRP